MKKIIVFFVLLFIVFDKVNALEINSKTAVLYNLDKDKIIYEKNKDDIISVASLTKIMTLIVAIENISDLNQKVVIKEEDFKSLKEENASIAGLYIGEELTYRDLLYATFLPSGADGAQALANNIGGSISGFVDLMNKKAEEIGMTNSHFSNPTGLDDKNNYSTVDDIAKLLKYAKNNEIFYKIFTSNYYTLSDNYKSFSNCFRNTGYANNIDTSFILGAKPGYTDDAGKCLASIAYDKKHNTNYLLVNCGAPISSTPYHLIDTTEIYKYFFGNYLYEPIIREGDLLFKIKCEYNDNDYCSFYSDEDIYTYVNENADPSKLSISINAADKISLKNKKGDIVGSVTVMYDGEVIYEKQIILNNEYKFSLSRYLLNKDNFYFAALLLCIRFFRKRKKKRKQKAFLSSSKHKRSHIQSYCSY